MAKERLKIKSEKDNNKTVSKDLLDSYRGALYKVKEFFDNIRDREFDEDNIEESMKIVQSVLNAGDKLGKNIETLMILEKKVQSEEMDKSRVRGGAKLSMLENGEI